MRRHRVVISLVFAALLTTSCGGDEGSEGAGGTTAPPPTTTSSTAPAAADPAMVDRAKAVVLQPSDFPPGWNSMAEDQGLRLDAMWMEILRCVGVENPGQGSATATSPTYVRGLATQAQSTVEYTTEAAAGAIIAALAGPRFQDCARQGFATQAQRSAPPGAVPGPVEVAPLDVPPAGTRTSALRATLTMSLQELQVLISQDFLVIFDDRAVIRMLFLNPGGPFPPDLERSLVEKVVGRA